jgi:hypothetical protein
MTDLKFGALCWNQHGGRAVLGIGAAWFEAEHITDVRPLLQK